MNRVKGGGGDNGRRRQTQFYRGRTTVRSDDVHAIRHRKEYRRKKLSRQRREQYLKIAGKWAIRFAVVLMIILGIMQLQVGSPTFTARGGSLEQADIEVLEEVSQRYRQSGLHRFKPFVNPTEYASYITENASFVSDAVIDIPVFGTEHEITVQVKQAQFPFKSAINTGVNGTQLWLANDGSLLLLTEAQVAELPQESGAIAITDPNGLEYTPGDSIMSARQIQFIIQASSLLEDLLKLELTEVVLQETPRDLGLKVAGKPFIILVNTERPVEVLETDLKDFLSDLMNRGVTPSQYIDVRVIDKLFYK